MKIALALLAPLVLCAQNAALSGLVKDAAQSPVAEARITVSQIETGTERTAKSNAAGMYALPALAPAHYQITVQASGFDTRTVESVELRPNQNARLDLTLEAAAGHVRGSVNDTRGGEALANVQVRLAGTAWRTVSDSDGRFHIDGVPPGDYILNVSTVGYHMEKQPFRMDQGENKEFTVVLTPDTLRQADTVEGKPDPFEITHGDSPDALKLAGTDAKNLGSVLADDPLRAVQNLPGVSSNKDYDARFSLRGADFSRIGIYLDGILLHEPFHEPKSPNTPGTLTAFNVDVVEEMDLHESTFPARFDDRTAAALDVETRDGSRGATLFRAGASASNAEFLAEGPFTRPAKGKPKASWLVAIRKSYLQYLLAVNATTNSALFAMEDVQAKLTYDLTPKNTLTFSVLESYSNTGNSKNPENLGINSLLKGGYNYTLAGLAWRYSPTSRLTIVNRAAWMREKFDDFTPAPLPLAGGYYGEWVWNSSGTWMWNGHDPLDFGASVRRIRDQGFSNQYLTAGGIPRVLDHNDGTTLRYGGYVQQSWSLGEGRLRLSAGTRWDRQSLDRVATVSPQASAALALTKTTRLQLGWGEYAQYPDLSVLTSPFGNRAILPSRSIHAVAAIEQKLGQRTRLRAELYDRADRDLPFQSLYDPRILNGSIFNPPPNPLYSNSLRGYSRGAEIFLQRSSANRFTGWLSYSYGHTMMRDGVSAQHFPSDYDQTHTVNAYGGFRVRPTVNLSLRTSYGSGFPIPGYLTHTRSSYYNVYLAPERNQLRLPAYQRTDLRINKAWMHAKWKFTLYAELINLTDHGNYYFQSFDNYDPQSGRVNITVTKTFPVLPSMGMAVEW